MFSLPRLGCAALSINLYLIFAHRHTIFKLSIRQLAQAYPHDIARYRLQDVDGIILPKRRSLLAWNGISIELLELIPLQFG